MTDAGLQADKEKLQEILSRDEYAAYERGGANPVMDWLERLWQGLLDLFPDMDLPPGTPKLLAYGLLGLLLIALASVIVWLVRSMILMRRSRRPSVFRSAAELGMSSAAHLEEARRCADEGAYPEAVRRAFLGLLLLLDEQGWIRAEKWKTNREYANELSERAPGLAEPFREGAAFFERVVYGGASASAADYDRMRKLAEAAREGGDRSAEAK
ncbi:MULTISPECIES: DUF4129 domain-containing protein [unclassified Paenibacillus]|uniref:DUF4129 domain-containing protein n=1 Tax=unclassified Paenibacillus TaxID=185978 RepID=UPI00093064EE|nr:MULTISPECIES: DUF4129 domain-containing protein [unclassified Paenibacillus]